MPMTNVQVVRGFSRASQSTLGVKCAHLNWQLITNYEFASANRQYFVKINKNNELYIFNFWSPIFRRMEFCNVFFSVSKMEIL